MGVLDEGSGSRALTARLLSERQIGAVALGIQDDIDVRRTVCVRGPDALPRLASELPKATKSARPIWSSEIYAQDGRRQVVRTGVARGWPQEPVLHGSERRRKRLRFHFETIPPPDHCAATPTPT